MENEPQSDEALLESLSADYPSARIHLLTERKDQNQTLLFAWVECLPHGFPPGDVTNKPNFFRFGNKHNLNFSITSLSLIEAWAWYQSIADGHPLIPGTVRSLSISNDHFAIEPTNHGLALDGIWPFLDAWHGQVRAQFLLPDQPAELSKDQLSSEKRDKLHQWLIEQMGFDLLQQPQWQGVVALIAPNPVYRQMESEPMDGPPDGQEWVRYRCHLRPGQSAEELELWLLEKRPSGLMAPRKFRFKNNQVIVKHDHLLATEALAMVCPQRGILGWHEPLSFLRSIHINQSVTKRTELIEVPKRGQKVAAYRYQSQQVSTPNEYIVPTSASRARTEQEQLRILAAMRGIRRQTEKARKPTAPTEYWFDQDSRDQAVQVIRGLIQRARERVWLIDPYITDRVLYEFGLAVQQEDADLRVLTSKKDRDSDQGPSQKHQSLHELHRRVIYFDAQGYSFLVRLLSDKALHDRFLVIDQQVWMAGSSFDSIGDSAGMFVQLREPEPIIERLAALFESGKPLETWIKDHGGSNGD